MTISDGRFPIQVDRRNTRVGDRTSIPWSLAEIAYAQYAARYGQEQSLARLAERGGFGTGEMDMFLPDWRERCDALDTAVAARDRLRAEVHRLTARVGGVEAQHAAVTENLAAAREERDRLRGLVAERDRLLASKDDAFEKAEGERYSLRGLLREAWPYVTEQYQHHPTRGPNDAAKLHDRIYCALPRLADGGSSGGKTGGLLGDARCPHFHDTAASECETCRRQGGG